MLWIDEADVSVCLLRYPGLVKVIVFVCLLRFMEWWSWYIGMPLRYTGWWIVGYLYACFVFWYDEANISVCLLRYTELMKFMVFVCLLHFMYWCSWLIGMPLRYTGLMDLRVLVCLIRIKVDEADASVCLLQHTVLIKVMVFAWPLHLMDWPSCYIGMPLRYTGLTDLRIFVCMLRVKDDEAGVSVCLL